MGLSIGAAIYIAVKPLAKIFLNCSMGFILAKKNVLTVETCQKVSIIIVTFLIPSLIFFNVITSLHGGEIKTIASIALTAFLFQALGLLFGLIVRFSTPTPKKWLGGILCSAAFGNINDLPIAYVTTLAAGPYFASGSSSQGTAYSVIFLVCFVVTFFNMGAVRAVAMDFRPENVDLENTIQQPLISLNSLTHLKKVNRIFNHKRRIVEKNNADGVDSTARVDTISSSDNIHKEDRSGEENGIVAGRELMKEKNKKFMKQASRAAEMVSATGNVASTTQLGDPTRRINSRPRGQSSTTRVSFVHESSARPNLRASRNDTSDANAEEGIDTILGENMTRIPTVEDAEAPVFTRHTETMDDIIRSFSQVLVAEQETSDDSDSPTSSLKGTFSRSERIARWCDRHHLSFVIRFITDFQRPQSVALIISMTLTMIPWTRRLFVTNGINMPDAPDGLPALDFIMDFTEFIGNASVPLGLSMLGATIARLELKGLPKGFWKSTLLMSVLKLCVLPIIAVVWTNKMISMGWIDADNKMAIFVIVVTSGVPMSTVQLYMTALYTKPGSDHLEVDCVAANMIVQYSMLVFSLTVVVTYALKNMADM